MDLEAPIFCTHMHVDKAASPAKFIQILNVQSLHFKDQRFKSNIVKFKRDYLASCDKYDKHCYCQQIESRMCSLDWHTYIWHSPILKVRVMVMHISTVNISSRGLPELAQNEIIYMNKNGKN